MQYQIRHLNHFLRIQFRFQFLVNFYLVKYKIADSEGSLLPEITNINELNRRFMKMKNDPAIIGATPKDYFTKQLGNTYNLLALKLK